jgi:hypothetical protein
MMMSTAQSDGTSNQSSSMSQPSESGKKWWDMPLKIFGAIAVSVPIISIVLALYTYYHQAIQQRKVDFLHAYDIVHGTLGKDIEQSIDDAIKPIYNSSDDRFWKARQRADEAGKKTDKEAAAIADIQQWITTNILVNDKNPQHDQQLQNYKKALSNLTFLYRYARTDPCTAFVVLSRFQGNAFRFWYYYPRSYIWGPKVTALPERMQENQLADPDWLEAQKDQCALEPRV